MVEALNAGSGAYVAVATPERTTLTGLDLKQMTGTVALLRQRPPLARFEFRATNRFLPGGENRSRIKEFDGAGGEDTSRSTHWEFVNGEPPVLLGANDGANPVEFLLHALAGCVTTTTVLHAAARGIEIRRLVTRRGMDVEAASADGAAEAVAEAVARAAVRRSTS